MRPVHTMSSQHIIAISLWFALFAIQSVFISNVKSYFLVERWKLVFLFFRNLAGYGLKEDGFTSEMFYNGNIISVWLSSQIWKCEKTQKENKGTIWSFYLRQDRHLYLSPGQCLGVILESTKVVTEVGQVINVRQRFEAKLACTLLWYITCRREADAIKVKQGFEPNSKVALSFDMSVYIWSIHLQLKP